MTIFDKSPAVVTSSTSVSHTPTSLGVGIVGGVVSKVAPGFLLKSPEHISAVTDSPSFEPVLLAILNDFRITAQTRTLFQNHECLLADDLEVLSVADLASMGLPLIACSAENF